MKTVTHGSRELIFQDQRQSRNVRRTSKRKRYALGHDLKKSESVLVTPEDWARITGRSVPSLKGLLDRLDQQARLLNHQYIRHGKVSREYTIFRAYDADGDLIGGRLLRI